MSTKAKPSAAVKVDPFAPKAPFHVIGRAPGDEQSPTGYVYGWKSEKLRNSGVTGGWKGWEALTWDHPAMADIHKYIPSAPMRMAGSEHTDNLVRRADLILCRINAEWFDARQESSAEESRRRVADLAVEEGQEILPGVTTFGGGRRVDKNPTFGGKPMDSELAAKLRNS